MTDLHLNATLSLCDGNEIPRLGFGFYQLTDPRECKNAIEAALDAGCRHFDTATVYQNEELLGEIFGGCGIARESLFLTTKCWMSSFGKNETRQALERSLRKLQTDYVDLYLLHWPKDDSMMAAWECMQEMQAEGKIKSIGVSNFSVARFEKVFFRHTDVVPAVNQIELHPWRQQADVQNDCRERNIAVEAYSPLARANGLDCETLKSLAAETGKAPAQVMLRWHLQQGRVVIPKSANPGRIRENCDLYDFSLNEDQMARIDALEADQTVSGWRPNDGIDWY